MGGDMCPVVVIDLAGLLRQRRTYQVVGVHLQHIVAGAVHDLVEQGPCKEVGVLLVLHVKDGHHLPPFIGQALGDAGIIPSSSTRYPRREVLRRGLGRRDGQLFPGEVVGDQGDAVPGAAAIPVAVIDCGRCTGFQIQVIPGKDVPGALRQEHIRGSFLTVDHIVGGAQGPSDTTSA